MELLKENDLKWRLQAFMGLGCVNCKVAFPSSREILLKKSCSTSIAKTEDVFIMQLMYMFSCSYVKFF